LDFFLKINACAWCSLWLWALPYTKINSDSNLNFKRASLKLKKTIKSKERKKRGREKKLTERKGGEERGVG